MPVENASDKWTAVFEGGASAPSIAIAQAAADAAEGFAIDASGSASTAGAAADRSEDARDIAQAAVGVDYADATAALAGAVNGDKFTYWDGDDIIYSTKTGGVLVELAGPWIGADKVGTESGGTLAQGLWWVTLEQFEAIPNTTSPAAATANKAALRAAVAWLKAKGGGTLSLLAGQTYYMGTAVGDNMDSMCVIDFENFNVEAGVGAKFTTSASSAASYFYYVTRGKFRANRVKLVTADGAGLTSASNTGVRLFCITDDDALGLDTFEINNCEAYGAIAHTIVYPKTGPGIKNVTGIGNYAEQCLYGLNLSASTSGQGPVENVNFAISGKNVYRIAFGFGHGKNINVEASQVYGHDNTGLANGTTVNWTIPKVSGWTWNNVNITCFSDEDWARGVMLSAQTDNADIAAGGANYPNRGFDGVNIQVICSRGKYSGAGATDYALYMGHINTDTSGTTTTALAVNWQNINANVVSPNDLSLGRLPITPPSICNTTTPQKGNTLISSAELFTSGETGSLKLMSPLFDFVSARGRTLLANAGIIKKAAGAVKTFVNYDDPHLEFGGDDTNNTRYRAGSAHTWFLGGTLTAYMTTSQFYAWTDNAISLGTTSKAWSDVQAYRVTTKPRTVAQLPAAGTAGAGARAFVSDSNVAASGNFGAVVAAGGANGVPVYSDGTNWRIG